jgi:hypothetical protein
MADCWLVCLGQKSRSPRLFRPHSVSRMWATLPPLGIHEGCGDRNANLVRDLSSSQAGGRTGNGPEVLCGVVSRREPAVNRGADEKTGVALGRPTHHTGSSGFRCKSRVCVGPWESPEGAGITTCDNTATPSGILRCLERFPGASRNRNWTPKARTWADTDLRPERNLPKIEGTSAESKIDHSAAAEYLA